MLYTDIYKTVNAIAEGTFSDKGSKFIAFSYPISSESEVKKIVSEINSSHPKANHYC
ncbi:MAG: YigZ family protein [Daejeonella sp.]|uniref:YigZ family protein n=1 Tax=Daejeonella sp. TaxID=2805397 RepID=UPI003C71C21A